MKVEFRNAAFTVVGAMALAGVTKEEAVKAATEHMSRHAEVETAHVFTENTETVVSRSTGWMKNNG